MVLEGTGWLDIIYALFNNTSYVIDQYHKWDSRSGISHLADIGASGL